MTSTAIAGFVCEYCAREFETEKGAQLHERDWCPDNPDSRKSRGDPVGRRPAGIADTPSEKPPAEPEPSSVFDEPPAERPGWRERLWGSAGKPLPVSLPERRPRKRRTPTDGVWMTIWTAAGAALVQTGADVPVGNCLQFQAPIVGGILDEAIKDTFVDVLIQPIAGSSKRLKAVSSVLAMPVLVGVMERSPQTAVMLEPLLRQAIREHLVAMAPVVKARKKADAEYRKALDELGLEAGDDPVDTVMEAIWAASAQTVGAQNGHAEHADVQP